MKRFAGDLLVAFTLSAAPAGFAAAHHSLSAYDTAKSIVVKGTVKSFSWENPHCWLDLIADDANKTEWLFEVGTPTINYRMGWHRTDLKPGEQVTVAAMPIRDGTHHGALTTVTMPDGTVKTGPIARRPPPGAK